MDSRELEAFIAAADAGSFLAASSNLYLSHSALMSQINKLEHELGFKLFTRGHDGIALTQAGTSFYKDAKAILSAANEAKERGRQAAGMADATVRIGYTPGVPSHVCSDVCARFSVEHPECAIEFVTADRYSWVDEALCGKIDVFESTRSIWTQVDGLGFMPLFDDPLCLLVSPRDPLTELPGNTVNLAELDGRLLYVQDTRQCEGFLHALRELTPGLEVRDMNADVAGVMKACLGGAAYLMPRSYAPFYSPLACVQLAYDEPYPVGLVYRCDCTRAVSAFMMTAGCLYSPQDVMAPDVAC